MIVCGFPGIGKTTLKDRYPDQVVDSDSSLFSWASPGVRHPEWPNNYLDHLSKLEEENPDKLILVSTHKEVISGLLERKIRFSIIRPSIECKQEYIERFIKRGSTEAFIELLDKNFETFLDDLDNVPGIHVSVLSPGSYLSDRMRYDEKQFRWMVKISYNIKNGFPLLKRSIR